MAKAFLPLLRARSPGEAFDFLMSGGATALDFVYDDFSTMSEIMARRAVRNALRDGKRSAFSVRRGERGYDVFLRPAFFPPPEGDRPKANPTTRLEVVIERFRASVADMRLERPDAANGACLTVSSDFLRLVKGEGLEARGLAVLEFPYLGESKVAFRHVAASVEGGKIIDWTMNQFFEAPVPAVFDDEGAWTDEIESRWPGAMRYDVPRDDFVPYAESAAYERRMCGLNQNPLKTGREAPPFSTEGRPDRVGTMSQRPFPYMEPLAGRIPRGAVMRLWDEAISRRELPCPRCGANWDAETPYCAACGTNAEIIRHAYAYGDEMPPKPIDLRRLEPLTDDTFVEVVQSLDVVIVFFAAPDTCPPCKEMHPIVKEMAGEGYPMVMVDIKNDAGEKLMDAYKVEGVPTFITFKDGRPLWRRDGPVTKTDLIRDLNDAQASR